MTRTLPAFTLCFLLAGTAAAQDAGADLAAAIKKAAAWDSYAFTVEQPPGRAEGNFQKGQPLHLKADKMEFFREKEEIVYLDGGKWLRLKRGSTLSPPLRILGALSKAMAVRPPHEDLAAVGRAVKEVARAKGKEDGHTVYSGKITEEDARELVQPQHRNVARGGTAKFWVGDGGVVKYQVAIRIQGRIGNAEVDGEVTRSVTVAGVGATKVDVPEPARNALK